MFLVSPTATGFFSGESLIMLQKLGQEEDHQLLVLLVLFFLCQA